MQQFLCPYCRSTVVPVRDARGGMHCPACNDTGILAARPPAPTTWAPATQPGPFGAQPNAPGAVAALVLGVVSFIPYVGFVTGGIAIYFGGSALRYIRENPGRYAGSGMAQAGRILGIVALALYVVTILFAAIVFVLVSRLAKNA